MKLNTEKYFDLFSFETDKKGSQDSTGRLLHAHN
jgi:hypothetical protein